MAKIRDVRCWVLIDDGELFSFVNPVNDVFIKNSINEFVGE
jgi:hypothetical protein